MTTLKERYQQFFRMGLLIAIIIPSILLSQNPPEEFQFNQSTLQAFYFFANVTLNGIPIESDDWLATFKGDICVGARHWDTSNCGGGQCDVPAMGDDGSEYTAGYMINDDIPTFKIYDSSENIYYDAIPSQSNPWSNFGFFMEDELNVPIFECSDNTACNYNENATESCSDCCIYEEDCTGECGGNAILDECGVCEGDNSTCVDCIGVPNGDSLVDDCEVCDDDPSNDCVQDCTGSWGGFSVEDNCAVCDDDPSNDCIQDCAGIWGGSLVNDECEVCDGDNSICADCAGEPNGDSLVDNCGTCDNDPSNDCLDDCAGVPNGDSLIDHCGVCDNDPSNDCVQDCAADWGGTGELDECGTCDSDLSNDCIQDCFNVWGGDAVEDDCGLCNGVSECSEFSSLGQCIGTFNVGEFNVNGFDCEGWCQGNIFYGGDECYDCSGDPEGNALLDDCGVCSGGESEHIANSDQDCENVCLETTPLSIDNDCGDNSGWDFYNDEPACVELLDIDECGVCGGDGNLCLYGCDDENATNYYCNEEINTCVNGQSPLDFIDNGSCTYDVEGTIRYFNSAATPIKDVLVTIYGLTFGESYAIDSDSTDIYGKFLITDVPLKNIQTDIEYESYYLEYLYSENSPVGINTIDAYHIAKVVVGLETFVYNEDPPQNYSAIAADVNLNGIINSYDASVIDQFMGDNSLSMNDSNIRWKFVSEVDVITTDEVTGLTGDNSILVIGIKLGDPNGTWE